MEGNKVVLKVIKKDALKVLAAKAAAQNGNELKKVLSVKNLQILLLYYGVEKKEIASMKVVKMTDHYKKLKDDNTPKKVYKR